jgi:hypothetical protein
VALDAATAPSDPAPTGVEQATAGDLSSAECAIRWALRIGDAPPSAAGDFHGAFSRSIAVSAVRCLLTYIVLPFVAPLIGVVSGVGPVVGLVVGSIAIGFNLASMRRFFIARHRWRWGYFAIGATVIVLLLFLMVGDVADLAGWR